MDEGESNRRSARVVLRIPISLFVGQDPPRDGLTAVVNRHGALVLSPTGHEEGTILWVRNEVNQETTRCRVVWVGLADPSGTHKIGIEFIDETQTFWGATYVEVTSAQTNH
jgi:hypothetical protein